MCRIPASCLERAKGFRARLESWLHKPEPGAEAGSAALGGKLSRDRGKLSEEALGWRDSFDQLLHNPQGLAAFRAFLKTEFSEENLEFWLACEDFKRTRSAAKLASRAHRIFEEFVRTEAPREVNIDHETRELTRRNLEAATAACFDQAQGQARALMEKDSFHRFLRSPAYLALLAGAPQPSQT
ncbi:regulator of G-protein signaling 16 isoform X1 [Ochotona princeps]|uniref:regulator of G-protein signaling 16 isoform X1 n=1 Tax=Ochotona princeps TaxID=9978 RepID=UPI0027150717|nr:regulator of G-protein signaling 16 isoform X1 [Ochotona princeps]